ALISVDKNTARATRGTDMPVAPPRRCPSMKKSAARIRLAMKTSASRSARKIFPRLHVARDVGESDAAAVPTHLEEDGFGEDVVRAEVVQPREQRRVLLGARGGTPVCTRHRSTSGAMHGAVGGGLKRLARIFHSRLRVSPQRGARRASCRGAAALPPARSLCADCFAASSTSLFARRRSLRRSSGPWFEMMLRSQQPGVAG